MTLDGVGRAPPAADPALLPQVEREENPKEPAGYLVHFSPRTGETHGSLIEFGFSGRPDAAGLRPDSPGATDAACRSTATRAKTGARLLRRALPAGQRVLPRHLRPDQRRFTYWFTGILMPFQYAEDEDDVRRYVGRQIAEALTPIARELRGIEGNYLRTMCESFYPLLLAYERPPRRCERREWLGSGIGGSASSCSRRRPTTVPGTAPTSPTDTGSPRRPPGSAPPTPSRRAGRSSRSRSSRRCTA